jgi:shikimate dehydrogenase
MKVYGLIGKPLTHSFSKKFLEQKLYCRYENFELPAIDALKDLVRTTENLFGLNVTIPYKEAVLPYLHFKNEIVSEIGACNCIKIIDGKLHGFNTVVIGFKTSIEKELKPHHKKALILGTGGAAKAVAYALNLLGIDYTFVSRSSGLHTLQYSQLNKALLEEYLLIINTTPLGMYPQTETVPDVPFHLITPRNFLYDLTYNPEKTTFLKRGEERGAFIKNGYDMLVVQAEESWKIWNA